MPAQALSPSHLYFQKTLLFLFPYTVKQAQSIGQGIRLNPGNSSNERNHRYQWRSHRLCLRLQLLHIWRKCAILCQHRRRARRLFCQDSHTKRKWLIRHTWASYNPFISRSRHSMQPTSISETPRRIQHVWYICGIRFYGKRRTPKAVSCLCYTPKAMKDASVRLPNSAYFTLINTKYWNFSSINRVLSNKIVNFAVENTRHAPEDYDNFQTLNLYIQLWHR